MKKICLIIMLLVQLSACKEWVEVPPPTTDLLRANAFTDQGTALAAVSDVYGGLASSSSFANGYLSIWMAAYVDELNSLAPAGTTSDIQPFYLNNLLPGNKSVLAIWTENYAAIYKANMIIEGLASTEGVSQAAKEQFMGEALFLRAFCHFYLVNLFGDVPLVRNSNYVENASIARTSSDQVYQAIIEDLIKAKSLLPDAYPSPERIRVNKGAVIALLARAYLYVGDNLKAETEATEIIGKTVQYQLAQDLNSVFLKTSNEAIWQLPPFYGLQKYTTEGQTFILKTIPPTSVTLRDDIVKSFDGADQRKIKWVGSLSSPSGLNTWYYAYKYKESSGNNTGAEYSMVLRLAEQYLIRAEARAKQDKLTGSGSASSDLNVIRNRAGLPNTGASSKEQLLLAIEDERKKELFTEWGHRFLDLRRNGKVKSTMSSAKANWKNHFAWLPLPSQEIQNNRNLTQNNGY